MSLLTGHDSVVIAIVVKNFLAFFDGSYGADHSIGPGIFLEIIFTILTIKVCKGSFNNSVDKMRWIADP